MNSLATRRITHKPREKEESRIWILGIYYAPSSRLIYFVHTVEKDGEVYELECAHLSIYIYTCRAQSHHLRKRGNLIAITPINTDAAHGEFMILRLCLSLMLLGLAHKHIGAQPFRLWEIFSQDR